MCAFTWLSKLIVSFNEITKKSNNFINYKFVFSGEVTSSSGNGNTKHLTLDSLDTVKTIIT